MTLAARPPNIIEVTSLPLVRVRLKHADVETFVQRFAPNITRGGIFLASRDPRPVGALVRFEVTLVDGQVMIAGQGRVAWVKPYDPAAPARAHGMGLQFTDLEPTSRPMFERLLARKDVVAGRPPPARLTPASGVVAAAVGGSGSGSAERRVTEGNLTEFDALEDTALRRALDRARALGPEPDRFEELLAPVEPGPTVTLEEALADLPRYFARGRGSGLFRLPPEIAGEAARPGAARSAPAEAPAAPAETAASPATSSGLDQPASPAILEEAAGPEEPPPTESIRAPAGGEEHPAGTPVNGVPTGDR